MQQQQAERQSPGLPEGCELAIAAEAFYIVNMILAPGLGVVMLAALYAHCKRRKASTIALNHLRQTMFATLWAGAALAVSAFLLWYTGGYPSPYFWPILSVYFLAFHIPMSWLGIVGFGRALSGEHYRYPVIGAVLLDDHPAPAGI